MTRLLVGTDSVETSEKILDYLLETLEDGDEVYVINSQVGGEDTSEDEILEGEEALEVLVEGLSDLAPVEQHQLVRGKAPVEEFLDCADDWEVDEYVIGIRKRSPVGKMVFGSTAQNLLLESDLPVRCIPLVSD